MPVIDFVPFGYDLDLFEIRMLESYDVVDVFVVYESPFTQRGVPKPLYFNESLATGRWDRFKDKIVHFIADGSVLAGKAAEAGTGSWVLVRGSDDHAGGGSGHGSISASGSVTVWLRDDSESREVCFANVTGSRLTMCVFVYLCVCRRTTCDRAR